MDGEMIAAFLSERGIGLNDDAFVEAVFFEWVDKPREIAD